MIAWGCRVFARGEHYSPVWYILTLSTFEFLTHAQCEMSRWLAESSFLFTSYLGRWKKSLLAGYHRSRGRPKSTFFNILKRDADVDSSKELEALMHDRRVWSNLIKARVWPK